MTEAAPARAPGDRTLPILILFLAMALGLFLRVRAARHDYISQWDEAYHALVAKNLAAHPLEPTLYDKPLYDHGTLDWAKTRIWLHKPPMALWLMALSMRIGGDEEFVFRIPSIALGTLSVLLTFLLALELFGERGPWAGAAAATLHALNPLMIRLTSGTVPVDHVDLTTVFFVELAVLLFLVAARRADFRISALAGAVMGLGVLTKSFPALAAAAAPVPLLLRMRRGEALKHLACALAVCGAVSAPWQLYCAVRWHKEFRWESAYTFKHLFSALEGHKHPLWWHFSLIPAHLGGIKLPACLAAAAGAIWCGREALKDDSPGAACALVWAGLPYLVFSLAVTKLYSYVSIGMPAVFLMMGLAAASIPALWGGGSRGRLAAGGLAAVLGLHVVSVVPERLSADYSVPPWNHLYDYSSFRRALRGIGAEPGPKVVFGVGDSKEIQAMYYAGCPAYPGAPPADTVRGMLDKGLQVYLLLDDAKSNWELHAEPLKKAGLLERVRVIHIRGAAKPLARHPFEN